jgi:hypothetical protein
MIKVLVWLHEKEKEDQLRDYIRQNSDSRIAHAYRLGRKDANIELSKSLQK